MGNVAEKLAYLEDTKTAIKTAIVDKGGSVVDNATFRSYADSIANLPSGGGDLTDEELTITGNANYMFYDGAWDWYIEKFGERIKTDNITSADYMFSRSNVYTIPFELNFSEEQSVSLDYLFYMASNLKELPKIKKCKPISTQRMFSHCRNIGEIPDDYFDGFNWEAIVTNTSSSQCYQNNMFSYCENLRKAPLKMFKYASVNTRYNYTIYKELFNGCYSYDEIKDLPLPYTVEYTNNIFSGMVTYTSRLKAFTFELENKKPKVKNMKSQTIDLSTFVGFVYTGYEDDITNIYSGISKSKKVTNDATYQALKNDADWYTTDMAYSRYNRTSAVETINSLPDTSAYLATAGGTNTIKFLGNAGSKTDGGAINTMTDAEIAVATAKGWTVTFA